MRKRLFLGLFVLALLAGLVAGVLRHPVDVEAANLWTIHLLLRDGNNDVVGVEDGDQNGYAFIDYVFWGPEVGYSDWGHCQISYTSYHYCNGTKCHRTPSCGASADEAYTYVWWEIETNGNRDGKTGDCASRTSIGSSDGFWTQQNITNKIWQDWQ